MKQTIFSTTLDNGIVLLGEELPGLESVAIAFHTPAGAVHDGPGRCGLATLSGEMMLRGAGDRSSRQIVDSLEGAGVQWAQSVSTSHASFAGAMVASAVVALPLFGWHPGLAGSVGLGFLYVFINALARPSLMAALANVPDSVRGTVLGLNVTSASFGWLGAAALGGWMLAHYGFAGFGPLAAVIGALGGGLAVLARR